MKKSELSNFLELTNVGTIILPIGEHKFELSQQAAENMVVALRGALRLLTKRAADVGRAQVIYCEGSTAHAANANR